MPHVASYAHRSDPPFEDEAAYRRRWSRLAPDALMDAGDLPVFIADHVPLDDRREGSVAFFTDATSLVPRFLALVPDAPVDPTDEECEYALSYFVSQLCSMAGTEDLADLTGSGFGLVLHRRGPSSVSEVDRRWRRVADEVAGQFGMHVVGVVVRTRNGAIVTVPGP